MTEKLSKIKFKYKFDKDYNPKYVNGAQGGITLQGDIVINFFLERPAVPISQTYSVREDGLVSGEILDAIEPSDFKESLIRYIQGGVVMSYPVAREIHRWLGETIKAVENNGLKKP